MREAHVRGSRERRPRTEAKAWVCFARARDWAEEAERRRIRGGEAQDRRLHGSAAASDPKKRASLNGRRRRSRRRTNMRK